MIIIENFGVIATSLEVVFILHSHIFGMVNNLLPFLYALVAFCLFSLAIRVMLNGYKINRSDDYGNKKSPNFSEDRTGQITIHPEILNQNGDITDEDLLTVRFSRDIDPPESAEKTAE